MIDNYIDWLKEKNIYLNKTRTEKLNRYAALVLKWNRKVNLTAAKDLKEIIERHILDSLMPLSVGFAEEKEVIDLGSGGGFPAIPLAIMLEKTDFLLVEKVLKKSAFLRRAKRELDLKNIEIENSLFEEIDYPLPDTLITRAVKIDEKMMKKIKKRGIKTLYTFESSKPDDFLEAKGYTLPSENKQRFIVRKEVK